MKNGAMANGSFRTNRAKFKKVLEKIERKHPLTIKTLDIGPWLAGGFAIATITIILIKLC